jgi:hypothetical protein
MDTSLSYTDRDFAYFSSDEPKWIRKIRVLKQEYPDSVSIEYEPETNDGCICAKVPVSWFRINPPKKRNLTEEQRREIAERLRKSHN